jgi:hypothetical protein
MCKKARDVVVKKVVSGPDRTVGTATTNKRGKWRSPFPKAKGSFYALVKQSVASQHNRQGPETCRGAKSKTIHVGR